MLVGRIEDRAAPESTGEEGFLSVCHVGRGFHVDDAVVHGDRRGAEETVIRRFVHILSHLVRLVRRLGLM
jgi:hypothetical protein